MTICRDGMCTQYGGFDGNGIARRVRNAEGVPGRQSVVTNLAIRNRTFQVFKSHTEPSDKLVAVNVRELGFRVVDVKNIDGIDTEIFQASVNLILQIPRRHAVAASRDVAWIDDAGADQIVLNVMPWIFRHGTIKRQISRLCGDNELIATGFAGRNQLAKRLPDGAFAPLESI